ncbi:hypothetical protein GQ42DRAFT_11269 [Ramicandelaber brevisporus]|nr:hypothetical protein GQ42DRAFT_11269 [Ramicandelaber brevisporus]
MPNKVMNRLRLIKMYTLTLTVDVVRFIFYCCPDLVELRLNHCTVSKDVIEHISKISKNVSSPMRQLRLMGYFKDLLDMWVEFVSKFRNLKEILVAKDCGGTDSLVKELAERCPYAKVKLYQS